MFSTVSLTAYCVYLFLFQCSEEISQARLNTLRGVANHSRIDAKLYQDYETDGAKAKRLAREAKELERLEKAAAKKGESAAVTEARRKELATKQRAAQASRAEKLFYKVTVRDNGTGMSHADIPEMLGRVLSGTKYGVKQTRGKFGLGAKMALIWSKMSTSLPIEVTSARQGSSTRSYYKLDIDIQRNEPNVHVSKLLENPDRWRGAELSVIIAGNWQYYRPKVLKYLQQIAVITPYAKFNFEYRAEDEKSSFNVAFARRTSVMPPAPKATKHHPSSVDLEILKRLAASSTTSTLSAFLCREFACVSKDLATRIIDEMRAGADPFMAPGELDQRQLLRLHQLLHEVRFPDPDGGHLSPAGEYNLRLGVMKELRPELVATYAGSVGVHEGHSFVVEAAVSVGGRDVKPGINIYRFANRIPLLFEGGSDVITRTALKRINWGAYKINQSSDKVGVFVSVVSTKIPFKGAGKEYMADDVEAIQGAVKVAIQQCGVQLKAKIMRQQAAREQKLRKKNLTKYIPNVAAAVHAVLKNIAADTNPHRAPKRRRLDEQFGVLAGLASGEVNEEVLAKKLTEHVERIDMDMVRSVEFQLTLIVSAWCYKFLPLRYSFILSLTSDMCLYFLFLQALEYQTQQGIAEGTRVDAYLVPAGPRHRYGEELHSEVAAVRLLT